MLKNIVDCEFSSGIYKEPSEQLLNNRQINNIGSSPKKRKEEQQNRIPAIEKLNKRTLQYIANSPEVTFDVVSKKFYVDGAIYHQRTSNELNRTANALELFSEISFSGINKLVDSLYINPYFAITTDVGKKIYDIVCEWPGMTFDQEFFYRARTASNADETYLEHDMLMPPQGIPSQGRYNDYGRSCFYFTDTFDGAINEVAGHQSKDDGYVYVVKIKPQKSAKLIDLSKMASNSFITAIRKVVTDEKAKVKKEYLLPNYIAGCCRQAGWDGIKYRGSGYKCYVTWNDASMKIEKYYSPIKISEWKKRK